MTDIYIHTKESSNKKKVKKKSCNQKKENFLRNVRLNLEDAFNFVCFLKKKVRTKVNNTKKSFSIEINEIRSTLLPETPETPIVNCFPNKDDAETNKDLIKGNQDKSSETSIPIKNVAKVEPLQIKQETQLNKFMISLISDDDSDSESSIIFIKGPEDEATAPGSSCLPKPICQSIKNETSVDPKLSKKSNPLSNNEEIASILPPRKLEKRKYGSDKESVQKKMKSAEEVTSTNFGFLGTFYKVRLTNLRSNVKYAEIGMLLQNAGLEYEDILLVNDDQRTYAEVSFIDPTLKEKAVNLDKTLMHQGWKIKINAVDQ